ncbi:LysR family transcriptional regulator [Rhizobium sp. NZLR1]|uniref:LysR family transcriptional regulator n=1 Tax=Rhizobium sp. NZLR1 TaxID=2731096 RepID=UPI002180B4A5|nr:LysR family transcriptional regulator [Rhizobium sp. NZLR1]
MELRHLRYFIAVAEEGSLTVAAEKRLHTAQPSLSRQLRDLELEVGAELFIRNARGITLTPAGSAFLDHARLALGQANEAIAAARRAARPAKATFAVGFLTGQEVDWLPHVTQILRAELPLIDFKVSSLYSPMWPTLSRAVSLTSAFCALSRARMLPTKSWRANRWSPSCRVIIGLRPAPWSPL